MGAEAMTPRQSGGSRWFTGFLVAAVIALGALCVLLVRQNRELKRELARIWAARATAVQADGIKPGDGVGGLELVGRDGATRTLAFGDEAGAEGPALVFIVGGACGYCERAVPVWDGVLTEMGLTGERGGGQIRIAAVQSDAREPADLKVVSAVVPVYLVRGGEGTWLRRVNIEPAAVLIDARGTVIKAWIGLPEAIDGTDLRRTLLDALTTGDGAR